MSSVIVLCRKAETNQGKANRTPLKGNQLVPGSKTTDSEEANVHISDTMENGERPHMVIGIDLGMTCEFC